MAPHYHRRMDALRKEIAALAARLIVEDGLDYRSAKRKAARRLGADRVVGDALPGNAEIEAQVREEIALFHADTQPAQLRALRAVALAVMRHFAAFSPHVSGAVWHGTATAHNDVHLDLYTDDVKAVEFTCFDLGVPYEAAQTHAVKGRAPIPRLSLLWRVPAGLSAPNLPRQVIVHLDLHSDKALRGALLPDELGRTPRGNLAALQALVDRG